VRAGLFPGGLGGDARARTLPSMTRPLLDDAFGHHTWATLRLIDACAELTPEQLAMTVPGTYGPIIDTMRHLVSADASYLTVIGGEGGPAVDADAMDVTALRSLMARNAAGWPVVLASGLDPDRVLVRHRPDGSESHAPVGVRIAQVLHHGTDHRSQVCTALTSLGIDPPAIDVWDYARAHDRLVDIPPRS
jgi:uncharacterized damage-inducible protein DinB